MKHIIAPDPYYSPCHVTYTALVGNRAGGFQIISGEIALESDDDQALGTAANTQAKENPGCYRGFACRSDDAHRLCDADFPDCGGVPTPPANPAPPENPATFSC